MTKILIVTGRFEQTFSQEIELSSPDAERTYLPSKDNKLRISCTQDEFSKLRIGCEVEITLKVKDGKD